MSALTSLLVRDRVVPISKIEEALQSQVLSGGDIDTVLLEMNAVPEDVLAAYRAALFGLLPATREEVMRAPHDAVRAMTRQVAQKAKAVPILLEGSALVVAVAEPLDPEAVAHLEAALGCELSMRVVTQPRLAAALHHYYGTELDGRTRRLIDALRKREPGIIPYVRPPSPSLQPRPHASEGGLVFDSRPPSAGEAVPSELRLSEPSLDSELLRASSRSQLSGTTLRIGSQPTLAVGSPPAVTETFEPPERGQSEAPPPAAGRDAGSQLPPTLQASSHRTTTLPPSALSPRVAHGARGPISRERAAELFAQSESRDDVLFVLLRYVQQFFDFVSIFSVGKEGIRGRMAHGVGLSQELMEHIMVPPDSHGLLGLSVRDKGPRVGDLSATDEERAAAALLGRPGGQPGIAVPIVLQGRPVLLVYADRDGEALTLDDAAVVTGLSPDVCATLKRLIVQKKTLGGARGSAPPGAGGSEPAPAPADAGPERADAAADQGDVKGHGSGPDGAAEAIAHAPTRGRPAYDGLHPGVAPASMETELTAVDLDAMVRAPGHAPLDAPYGGPEGEGLNRAGREALRSQLPGVPRTAPPPPIQTTTKLWQSSSSGAYSYTSTAGLVSERVRTASEPAPSQPPRPRESAPQAASRRLSLVSEADEPSVIIDMGDHVTALVESLARATNVEEAAPQIEELLKIGEGALPVLLQYFPGALWITREELAPGQVLRGRDVSATGRAIIAFGDRAAPYVASLVSSSTGDTTFYGLLVATEIVHSDLLDPLVRRAFDADDATRALALSILRGYQHLPRFPFILRALSDLSARSGRDRRRQRLAVQAMGALRDTRALRPLLARLSDPDETVVTLAHAALVELSAQDFGLSLPKWEAWIEQHEGEHRVEWLIESLMHPDTGLRALADKELKALSQQYFGYHPSLSKRERELVQRKYRDWWQREGRALSIT